MENDPEDSRAMNYTCTYQNIFGIIRDKLKLGLDAQLQSLEEKIAAETSESFSIDINVKELLKKLLCRIKNKWIEAHRTQDIFVKRHEKWLQTPITILNCQKPIGEPSTSSASGVPGRPRKSRSEESSERTKKRRALEVSETYSVEELTLATRMRLSSAGLNDAAIILKDITTKSPSRAAKYRAAYGSSIDHRLVEMSGDEDLVDFVNTKLTKQQYIDIRGSLRKRKITVYPSYAKVVDAKKRCYPSDIMVTETLAEVKLQSLMDHTCDRILMVQTDVINSLGPEESKNLRLICKCGCDGSSGHSEYKQKFTNNDSSDGSIFLTYLVPLQILGSDISEKEFVLWKNPRSSSPRYCRPIRLQFSKETVSSTIQERQHVDNQIESLIPFTTLIDGKEVTVKYELHFTMIDGKLCSSVTNIKSAMRCYICIVTSSKFNDLELMKTVDVDRTRLELGLSTLHAWIRFFECFLHIGYKIGLHKWQTRKVDEKSIVAERKRDIQAAFKKELHLDVDKPKQGFGSSNDGNTARRFFEHTQISAKILGLDGNILKRVHIILQVLSTGFAVNVTAFKQYCLETAEMYVTVSLVSHANHGSQSVYSRTFNN